ncbi:MAG: hypothetical protein Q8Q65_00045 [bacterium]|nr:hypothetical protein [bacterium]
MVSSKDRKKIQKFVGKIKGIKNKKHKYASVLSEFKQGNLYSSAGYKVINPKQAQAIALSMSHGKRFKKKVKKIPKAVTKRSFLARLSSIIKRGKS